MRNLTNTVQLCSRPAGSRTLWLPWMCLSCPEPALSSGVSAPEETPHTHLGERNATSPVHLQSWADGQWHLQKSQPQKTAVSVLIPDRSRAEPCSVWRGLSLLCPIPSSVPFSGMEGHVLVPGAAEEHPPLWEPCMHSGHASDSENNIWAQGNICPPQGTVTLPSCQLGNWGHCVTHPPQPCDKHRDCVLPSALQHSPAKARGGTAFVLKLCLRAIPNWYSQILSQRCALLPPQVGFAGWSCPKHLGWPVVCSQLGSDWHYEDLINKMPVWMEVWILIFLLFNTN